MPNPSRCCCDSEGCLRVVLCHQGGLSPFLIHGTPAARDVSVVFRETSTDDTSSHTLEDVGSTASLCDLPAWSGETEVTVSASGFRTRVVTVATASALAGLEVVLQPNVLVFGLAASGCANVAPVASNASASVSGVVGPGSVTSSGTVRLNPATGCNPESWIPIGIDLSAEGYSATPREWDVTLSSGKPWLGSATITLQEAGCGLFTLGGCGVPGDRDGTGAITEPPRAVVELPLASGWVCACRMPGDSGGERRIGIPDTLYYSDDNGSCTLHYQGITTNGVIEDGWFGSYTFTHDYVEEWTGSCWAVGEGDVTIVVRANCDVSTGSRRWRIRTYFQYATPRGGSPFCYGSSWWKQIEHPAFPGSGIMVTIGPLWPGWDVPDPGEEWGSWGYCYYQGTSSTFADEDGTFSVGGSIDSRNGCDWYLFDSEPLNPNSFTLTT